MNSVRIAVAFSAIQWLRERYLRHTSFSGSINIRQESNGDSQTQYVGHNQNYGLTASLAPRERFGLDLA
ncbi:MAG: hypothetical protein WB660_13945 [Candidatus Sulfotelmatobacter sp.]